ncbi:MAG TPA: hypothetical protein ENJ51_08390, partial [Leucothrix mucor]|nr:hypothetical protein [Leucothrix mucor]
AGQQLISEKTVALDGKLISSCDYLYFPDSFHLMAIRQDNEIYYSHLGRRGEVLAMTDTKGEVVWKADYSAFGIAHISIEKIEQPFRLAGHYYDNETGLYYVLVRYYSPHLGRFLSRDPLFTEGGSQNFYLYCDGDPLNRIDPTGEFIFTAILIGAVIGAVIGAGIEAYRQSKAIERGEQQGYDGWGIAKAGAIGGAIGAVGGGVGAAVEGAFAVGTAATIAGGAGIGAVSGVASSLAEQCAEAALKDKPLDPLTVAKQALIDGGVGAVIGAVTGGTGGFLARRARKGVQEGIGAVAEQVAKEAAEKAAKEATEKVAKEAAEKAAKEATEKTAKETAEKAAKTDVPDSVTRTDHDFMAKTNHKGGKKSHIDDDGNLRPANPDGDTTISQHIRGGTDVKDNSPYTSTVAGTKGSAKIYGNKLIEIDTKRLQQDIDAGKIKGVEIITPKEVQSALQDKIDVAKKRYNDNPSIKNKKRLANAERDLSNAVRDNETLIKGVIPSKYINIGK